MDKVIGPKIPLIILLLLATSFVIETKAKKDLIQEICNKSQDPHFCTEILRENKRASAADRNELATIAAELAMGKVQVTFNDEIPRITKGIQNPKERIRMGVCRMDYESAVKSFIEALGLSHDRSYKDMLDRVRDATNNVIDCENVYKKYPPIVVCPITDDNHYLIKVSEIILIIVDGLLPH